MSTARHPLGRVPDVVAIEGFPSEDDDLAYRPQLDVEAQCLCALMWAAPDTARVVVDVLTAEDFYRPIYGNLFTVIARLVQQNRPHRSVLVLAELQRSGAVRGNLCRALVAVTTAEAREYELAHYARAVLSRAYRRGYALAAQQLAGYAEQADEDELFELMCQLGRERRTAAARLAAADAALHLYQI